MDEPRTRRTKMNAITIGEETAFRITITLPGRSLEIYPRATTVSEAWSEAVRFIPAELPAYFGITITKR